MKQISLIVSLLLLAFGVAILVSDAYMSHRYGFHMNEVVGFTEAGEPIDWPTGDRPVFALIPIRFYALGFCFAVAGIFLMGFRAGRSYRGRIFQGTE